MDNIFDYNNLKKVSLQYPSEQGDGYIDVYMLINDIRWDAKIIHTHDTIQVEIFNDDNIKSFNGAVSTKGENLIVSKNYLEILSSIAFFCDKYKITHSTYTNMHLIDLSCNKDLNQDSYYDIYEDFCNSVELSTELQK